MRRPRRSSIGGSRHCRDLGATRNILEGIGSTDHVPFNEAGLPGFNVIKDFRAYDERTRHTNADFPERMSEDALKQSAIFMATFAWQAATSREPSRGRPRSSEEARAG
jgi:Zn-dependent M28 family amino/carboxypeptidase